MFSDGLYYLPNLFPFILSYSNPQTYIPLPPSLAGMEQPR